MSAKKTITKKPIQCNIDQLCMALREFGLKKHHRKPKSKTNIDYESMSEDEEEGPVLMLTETIPIPDCKVFANYPEGYFWVWHKGRFWTKSGDKQEGKWWSVWCPKQTEPTTSSSSSTAPPELFKWFSNEDQW